MLSVATCLNMKERVEIHQKEKRKLLKVQKAVIEISKILLIPFLILILIYFGHFEFGS